MPKNQMTERDFKRIQSVTTKTHGQTEKGSFVARAQSTVDKNKHQGN